MSKLENTCPFLGLQSDPSLRLIYADEQHRCYALPDEAVHSPDRDFQESTCLTETYRACARYRLHLDREARAPDAEPQALPPTSSGWRPWVRPLLWGLLAVMVVAVGLQLMQTLAATPVQPVPLPTVETSLIAEQAAASPALNSADETPGTGAEATPAPPGVAIALSTPALAAEETQLELTPAPDTVGWVGSRDELGNHFGDSFLHAGVFQNELLHGAVQFDLSRLERGAPIRYAALELTGLDDSRLDRNAESLWEVRWLAPIINENWSRHGFQEIHNAPILQSIVPPVDHSALAPLSLNRFEFSEQQRELLQQAVINGETELAFRLDGPQFGTDNLFTWDTGYGPATLGNMPRLLVVVGPPPPTPPPVPTHDLIVVTSTPTAENVLTAVAMLETATAFASLYGEPAPTPRNVVTATPTPENEATEQAIRLLEGRPPVITATPTPGNAATATIMAMLATAQALTTGTPQPLPANVVTATPTPTFVVVTNTPTAADVFELLARLQAEATRTAIAGLPTAFPPNVVTATPSATPVPAPENEATAAALQLLPTIAALTIGTYTPTPEPGSAVLTPTPTLLPTLAPAGTMPEPVRDKIVFWSSRSNTPRLYAVATSCADQGAPCPAPELLSTALLPAYEAASWWQMASPDGQQRLVQVSDLWGRPQIAVLDAIDGTLRPLTDLEGGAHSPNWSPQGDRIAFVSAEAGNDEIYTMAPDGSDLRRLTFNTWEWDQHPSWSPDGSRILFSSNRGAGRRQLWIMNADGSGQRDISQNTYSDWDPVWIWTR